MKNGSRYSVKDPPLLRVFYIVSISKALVTGFLSKATYFNVIYSFVSALSSSY
jgi:hypothetical protein